MRPFFAWIAVGAMLLSASANAAIVYLKDGSQVRGTVVAATAQDLQLHTPDGTLNIAADRILRVDYAESATPAAPEAPSSQIGGPPARDVRRSGPRRRPAPEPEEETSQLFSLGFGFSAPLSRVDFSSTGGGRGDNGDSGLYLGAQYLHDVSPRLGAGFNIEYLGRSPSGSQSLLPEANTDVSGNTLLLLATMKFSFTDRGAVRPFVLAGLGANQTSTIVEATPNEGFGWSDTNTGETRTLVDDSHWGLATTARLGLDFMFDPSIFTLEFGWNGLTNANAQATRAGRDLGLDHVTGNLSALTFAARWGWRF